MVEGGIFVDRDGDYSDTWRGCVCWNGREIDKGRVSFMCDVFGPCLCLCLCCVGVVMMVVVMGMGMVLVLCPCWIGR